MQRTLYYTPGDALAEVEEKNLDGIEQGKARNIARAYDLPLPIDGLVLFLTSLRSDRAEVLDLGCGVGRIAAYLSDHGKDYTGLDFARGYLEEAHECNPGVPFVCASMSDIPFPDGSFDGVFACCSLQYTPKMYVGTVLESVRTVLRPQGVFVVMLPYIGVSYEEIIERDDGAQVYHSWWDTDEFEEALVAAGFLVEDSWVAELDGTSYFLAIKRSCGRTTS